MAEDLLNLFTPHAFEMISLLISLAALVYAALALKTARQAIVLTQKSDLAALRLKARDEVSTAERSLLKLQEACHHTRGQWDQHERAHYPRLGPFPVQPQERKRIAELERAGHEMLQSLEHPTSLTAANDAAAFECIIERAQDVAVKIERLILELEGPKPFGH